MTEKSELGKLGEDLACRYLKKRGYKIIERNYWQPWGELDVVAVSPEKILVLVEVKTVEGFASPNPPGGGEGGIFPLITGEDHFTSAKSRKFKRAAELYANGSKLLNDKGWRIDLVAITVESGRATMKHYENI